MKNGFRVSHPIYNLLPTEIEGFDSLAEPRRSISLSGDGVRPAQIKDDRLFATNSLLLKSFVPGKRTSKAILAPEIYGKSG